MRKARGLFIGFALLLLQPLYGSAQVPELLLPVDKDDIAKLESKSNYLLRSTLYSAKRYRFVHIDFELLDRKDAEFTITPFPDLPMQVVARRSEWMGSDGLVRRWIGELTSPKFLNETGVELPDWFVHPQIDLFIRKGEHQVSLRVAKKIADSQAKQLGNVGQIPNLEGAPEDKLSFTKLNLETVMGHWFLPARARNYYLEPISDDPRFHVIYEGDPEKTLDGGHTLSEEGELKAKRRAEFMEALEQEKAKAGQ